MAARPDPRRAAEPAPPGGAWPGRRPRVAILTGLDVRAYRGGEKYAASLGRELRSRGVEVRLLSKVDPHEHYRLSLEQLPGTLGLPVEFYRLFWLPGLPPIPLAPRRLLRALAWADAIYTMESTPRFAALIVLLARLLGRRVVVGLHHPTFAVTLALEVEEPGRRRWGTRLSRVVLRAADVVHVLNAHQAAALARIGVARNVVVVGNYASVPPPPLPPSKGVGFEALFVGPLEREQKGIDLLADIARRVLGERPEVRLTIVGTGRDVARVEALVGEFPGRVRYLGFVPEERLTELYAEANALWMTSRAEAFPAVALEAFSHGVPVVGFAVPGLEELSAVYPEGRVPPFDAAAFASTAVALARLREQDRAAFERLRERCRAGTAERFDARVQIPRLAAILAVPLAPAPPP